MKYPKGNRDEWIPKSQTELISGPFLNSTDNKDPEYIKKSIAGLNEYYQTKILAQPSTKPAAPNKKEPAKKKEPTPPQKAPVKP